MIHAGGLLVNGLLSLVDTVQRSSIGWHDVAVIAEKIPKTLPDCAARVIRSHLDYLLTQAG